MLTLFTIGTLWFWVLLLTAVISITALIENEFNVIADIIFVATFVILYKLGCKDSISNIGNFIATHPIYTLLISLGYFVLGTLYSIVKWAVFVSDGRAELIRNNEDYYASSWKPGEHKAKITHWMIYWPISGIWTLISNPVVKLFNRIFYKLEVVYQSISDKIMKDLIDKKPKY